ncbi:MAG: DMT family transporter [Xanthobacteraceae bacterium]|nr:DMT family transporter [Xanthobacteraceae bacterium]
MSATDWALLLLLSVLWGGSFYFAKIAVPEIPPLTLALGRVGIAAAALAILARLLAGPFPRDPAVWLLLTVMAALNNAIPFTLIFWGQLYISIGLASILNATTPLFGVLVAHALTRDDRLTAGRVVGLIAGFIGVVVLIGPGLLSELGSDVLAELACLAAACFYAFGAVLSRRLRGVPPIMVASGQLTMSTVLLLPFVLLFDKPSAFLTASNAALGALIGIALLSSALAYLIYFRLIARAGATNALLVTFLIPVSAILMGIVLLDESLSARQLAGMIAIFIGVAAIDGRVGRFIARKARRTNS